MKKLHCRHFPVCGGCETLDLSYNEDLQWKEKALRDIFQNWRGVRFLPILPSPQPYHYRHKVQLPFGHKRSGKREFPVLGILARDRSRIIDMQECRIQDESLTEVVHAVRRWALETGLSPYNEMRKTGLLRHLVLRKGLATGEILVGLVTNQEKIPAADRYIPLLRTMIEEGLEKRTSRGHGEGYGKGRPLQLVGIVQNINRRSTSMVLGSKERILYGRNYMTEMLGNHRFPVGLGTFFQVNPYQIPHLYNLVRDAIPEGSHVIDGYAGIATISHWIADRAGTVTAVESNIASVKAAKEALRINQVTNVQILRGEAERILPDLVQKGADTLVLDPPREGLDRRLSEAIVASGIKRAVYVSCNPETLERDAAILRKRLPLRSLQPVDMFPFAGHLETVARFGDM